jgi:hypothetical protein
VNRDSIIKGLAVLVAAGLVLFVGFEIVKIYINISKQDLKAQTNAPVTLDANGALKATIDTLEASWQKIQNYSFKVDQDPLHLGRVLKDFSYSQAGYRESEEEDRIRLTATVVDDNPKAIIKVDGKSFVVQVGERVDAYRVVSIGKKQVVLESSSGGRVILYNKPVQGLEESGGQSDYSNNAETETSNY